MIYWNAIPSKKLQFCTKINIPGRAAGAAVLPLRRSPLMQRSNLHESKNHSLVPQIKHTSFQRFKNVWAQNPQQDINDSKENTESYKYNK